MSASPPLLDVLSLNIHGGLEAGGRRHALPALRDALRARDADAVFLQEVSGEHRAHAARFADWPPTAQADFLAHGHWPHHAYGRNARHAHGHLGNALLSRHRLVQWSNHDVSVPGDEARGVLHGVIDVGGIAVHAACVHFGLRAAHRDLQAQRLCMLLARAVPDAAPLVVAGDFNDWRGRLHPALRRCGLREAFVEAHGTLARTFPSRWPLLPLDRIYVRGPLRVVEARVLDGRPWSQLSDHLALEARLALDAAVTPGE